MAEIKKNIKLSTYWFLRYDGSQYWVMYISDTVEEEYGSSPSLQTALNMYCDARAIRYYKDTSLGSSFSELVSRRNGFAQELADANPSFLSVREQKIQWGGFA